MIAWSLGQDFASIGLWALVLAAAPLGAMLLKRPIKIIAFALTVALVGQTSLLVFAFTGHPWQVEMHFYYFAVLAMLSGFCEWSVLVTAAALIAVHHLGLNAVLPAAIYPGGSNFIRVVVHAVVVVVETAMLLTIGQAIRSAFAQAERARAEAEMAASELKRSGDKQDKELAVTTMRADRMADLLERFHARSTSRRTSCRRPRMTFSRTPTASAKPRPTPTPSRWWRPSPRRTPRRRCIPLLPPARNWRAPLPRSDRMPRNRRGSPPMR